ncbi:hypothetical protein [Streptomyces sp. NPDC058476]|uniref:hypothetical protein n=1 Tax=Streptomyces sp. NPDC058476 TaxID=3346519 RepID=UPI00365B841D
MGWHVAQLTAGTVELDGHLVRVVRVLRVLPGGLFAEVAAKPGSGSTIENWRGRPIEVRRGLPIEVRRGLPIEVRRGLPIEVRRENATEVRPRLPIQARH